MRQYGDQLVSKQPGRKCLSRTQMSEPYELSQDLLDKQLEMLGSRYGGLNGANDAANTIQRAYRRYSMMKKFAAITSAAQVKNENRLSKRFQGLMTQQQQQHTVRHVTHVHDSRENMQHVSTSYHQHCSHNNYNHQSGADNIFSIFYRHYP